MRTLGFIVLFRVRPFPITQHFPLFDGHFDESDGLRHGVSRRVVPKCEQVEPARKALPVVSGVAFEEQLEKPMHPVDRFHRVLLVREPLRLGYVVYLRRRAIGDDLGLALGPVGDEARDRQKPFRVDAEGLLRGGVADAADGQRASPSVRRGAYAVLVPRKPADFASARAGRAFGWPFRDVLLVDPRLVPEDDSVLGALQAKNSLATR